MSSSAPGGWKATFANVPPLTKSVSTAMTVMTSLGLVMRFRDMAILRHLPIDPVSGSADPADIVLPHAEATVIALLAMVPVSAPYRFWTFATASFFETSIIQFVFNTAILLGSGKYLERAWGSREFFKFLAVSSVGSMIAVYLTCLLEFIIHGNEDILFETRAYGLTAVMAGFLVGFKQLVPEHLVTIWGIFSVRVKTLPSLFVVFVVIQSLMVGSQVDFMLAIYGLIISWIYARFYKTQDGVRGDRSETFSFASFFPEAAQPLIKPLSNTVFGILVRLRLCSPIGFGVTLEHDLENPQISGPILPMTQPASLRAEAERRRALALKALDMRLHAAAGNTANLPGLGQKTFLGPTPSAGGPIPFSSIPSKSQSQDTSSPANEILFEAADLDDTEPGTGRVKESANSSEKE